MEAAVEEPNGIFNGSSLEKGMLAASNDGVEFGLEDKFEAVGKD